MSRIIGPGLVLTLALLAAGCGESLNLKPATGTVTYKGQPVSGASVTFLSADGKTAAGSTDSAGKYTIYTDGKPGAAPGKHGVMISKSAASGAETAAPTPEDMMKMAQSSGRGASGSSSKSEIPIKYATTQGSGLTAEVTADAAKNVFDFQLAD